MKKTLLLKSQLFLILVFIFQMTFGQCPDSDLTFETQEEIDQFLEDYPDCTELDVHVTIGTVNPNTTNITNLNGLQNITKIHASLTIRANGSLVNLQGLQNLTTIEDNFRIEGNDALQNFNGLDNLNSIGGYFTVLNNDALDNFEGISNLSAISEDLLVKGNTNLENFAGATSLMSVGGYLKVEENSSLLNFSGLDNLTNILSNLEINSNNNLQNLQGLGSLFSIGENLIINENNALQNFAGINSLETVGFFVNIRLNENLSSLEGLTSLYSVGHYFRIEGNHNLTNLSGLETLTTIVNYLSILNNNGLLNLEGLNNLNLVEGDLYIGGNDLLTDCSAICEFLNIEDSVGGTITIQENLTGCNSLAEIETDCNCQNEFPEDFSLSNLIFQCSATEEEITVPIISNSCDETITATTETDLNFEEFGEFQILWNFENSEGEIMQYSQTIIIQDTIDPVTPTLLELTENCELVVTEDMFPTTEDNCAGIITATTESNLVFDQVGEYEIEWTFTDTEGNSVSTIQIVNIVDTINPEIPELEELTENCELVVSEEMFPTTEDNCAGIITATSESNLVFDEIGEYEIEWIFTDAEGNSVSTIQIVNIVDTVNPEIPELEELTENCELVVTEEMFPTTEDNCAGIITATTESNLVFDEIGEYEIDWIFTDTEGNSVSTIQIVNIVDTVNPEIPELEELTENCELIVTEEMFPTTEDNCTGIITATTESNLIFDQVGEYEIEWIFTDNGGNSVSSIQIINIIDEENPEIPILETLTLECNNSEDLVATTFDNCDGEIEGVLENNNLAEGENIVTWIFEDSSGNSVTANQTIILIDDAAPTPPVIPITFAECEFTVTTVPTAYDLCSDVIIVTHDQESLTYNSPGEYFIVWTFEDDNGNISETTQVIVIEDTEAPTFENCPENKIIDLNISCEYEIPDFTDFDFDLMDNCSNEISIVQTPEAGTIITENTEITISFTDDAENESQCNFIIEIVDTTAPEIECPGTQNILVEADESYTLEDFTTEIPVLNACDNYTITQNPEAETELEIGYHVVTLEIVDDFGNTQSCQFIVNVTTDLDISETEIENQISIYPNPATDILKIESLQEIQNVYVLDLNGKIILKQKYENQNIDVSNIYRGMYFVKIETKNKSILQKILLK
ncbi:HYR domain-containing protein [Aureivirga sp. CE67]|uniref:HYR domain-containing protein n=1 Tax=Aureivirga sp. CE67 TaxID=1788983 RepID=UPI0018CABFF1|nr:HYR domain-containing protein [Aureivirga sp. CE67]